MSLKDRLYAWFKKQPKVWRSSVEIEKMVSATMKHGGSYATRQLRLLAEERLLEREERPWKGRRLAFYRFNPDTHGPTLAQRQIDWFNQLP